MNIKTKSLLILLFVHGVRGLSEGDSCVRKHDGHPGVCIHYRKCTKARDDYNRGIRPSVCEYVSNSPIMCCPTEIATPENTTPKVTTPSITTTTITTKEITTTTEARLTRFTSSKRISEQKCEEYAELTIKKIYLTDTHWIGESLCKYGLPLIFGGVKTKNGEFPHMAALGWEEPNKPIEFLCGGSLISENFVLTAAHCTKGRLPPTMVRLGDQNIRSKADGLTELDVPVAEFIPHEEFRPKISKYFDIALIRLSRSVDFTPFIRPACLWQTSHINYTKTIATGWGKTENRTGSDELLKVELDIIKNNHCNSLYDEWKVNQRMIDSQMCAGVLEGVRDSCKGDSGGPIQVATPSSICLFHIVGITSFGSTQCGIREISSSLHKSVVLP